MRMYIAVLDEVPDHMVPVLVAHAVLGAHIEFSVGYGEYVGDEDSNPYSKYNRWLEYSFKKCVLRVNRKEFEKIKALPFVYLAHENTTLSAEKSCAVVMPFDTESPNVLKFAKLWSPKNEQS